MRYMLIVSFPMPALSRLIARTQAVVDVVGRQHQCGAGSGFGGRDVEFEFETADECDRAIERVALAFPKYRTMVMDDQEDVDGA